jgi:hypothetical protein
MGIFTRLAEFDGKSNATLKSIKRSTEVSTELLSALIEITGGEDAHMQMGATWLLRAYLEEGARLDAGQVERLSDSLAELHDGFGRIHICQSMPLIQVPEALAETFCDFFRSSRGSRLRRPSRTRPHRCGRAHAGFWPGSRRGEPP